MSVPKSNIQTLCQYNRTTSSIIKERVEESEKTEREINEAREKYRAAATRGSIIYFVISDLASIDPMYQYSLTYYQTLFNKCIEDSEKSESLERRLHTIIEYSTVVIYENICRGLFEKDKILFSSLICFQVQRTHSPVMS
jgi:dynein heavy chain